MTQSGLDGIRRATALLSGRPPRLGAIRLGVVDGPSGSGKSTFALAWAEALRARAGAEVASASDRAPPVAAVGSPGGAGDQLPDVAVLSSDLLATWDAPFDWWPRLEEQVLRPLAAGSPGRLQVTEWTADGPRPGPWIDIAVPRVLILEGVSCGRHAIKDRSSVLVWVEHPGRAERLERSVARDGQGSRADLRRWQDDEDRFFATDDVASRADVVVDAAG